MLTQLLTWIASKTWLKGIAELGDIVGPLIQAEELIKLDPQIGQLLKVRYDALRERIKQRQRRRMRCISVSTRLASRAPLQSALPLYRPELPALAQ